MRETTLSREVGAAARAELANDHDRLGYRIRPGTGHQGRYFEVEGVPEELLRVGEPAGRGCADLAQESHEDPLDRPV
ncbi:hypothetical protein OG701_07530 [Streptomyces uncialis]|nr:hypothetical protein [Streptomyces uncialis]